MTQDPRNPPSPEPIAPADDLEAIRQLKARYFRFTDTKDWNSGRQVFAQDVIAKTDTGVSTRGGDPMTTRGGSSPSI